jgi:hypothetical protein
MFFRDKSSDAAEANFKEAIFNIRSVFKNE